MSQVLVRPIPRDADLTALTHLIHAAYAPHTASGLRFWGTHQTVEDTAKRLSLGDGLVAEVDGVVVGTITVRASQPNSPVPLYRAPEVRSFSQFAVDPRHKGTGIGLALHEAALALAASKGASTMALDTAAPARNLIEMYKRWGYDVCGECDWRPRTNFVSVLMRRAIPQAIGSSS